MEHTSFASVPPRSARTPRQTSSRTCHSRRPTLHSRSSHRTISRCCLYSTLERQREMEEEAGAERVRLHWPTATGCVPSEGRSRAPACSFRRQLVPRSGSLLLLRLLPKRRSQQSAAAPMGTTFERRISSRSELPRSGLDSECRSLWRRRLSRRLGHYCSITLPETAFRIGTGTRTGTARDANVYRSCHTRARTSSRATTWTARSSRSPKPSRR